MTMRPCLDCGVPTASTRCSAHSGYDAAWERLSQRARKLQPWCSDCGSTENLQTDHSPEAWVRKAAGKRIRLRDVDVVCGPCNRARGQARPDMVQHKGFRHMKVIAAQRQRVGGGTRSTTGRDAPAAEIVTHRDLLRTNGFGAPESAAVQRVSRADRS